MNAPPRESSRRSLRADQRGAVLLIGIFVALALVASLWFLIGIGDAIAFRETAQEASDAAVFSSSVVHARGMNFIAAVNLIMFGVTVVYLILSIIADLFAVSLLACTGIDNHDCNLGTSGAAPATLTAAGQDFRQSADAYQKIVEATVKTGDRLQKLVAISSPWAGTFAANRIAARYDGDLVASTVGLSHEPGIEGSGLISPSTSTSATSARLGLPVRAVPAKKLCERAFSNFDVATYTQGKSGQNYDLGFPPVKLAVEQGAKAIGPGAHCSGGFWEQDGPKLIVQNAQNGSDYMQVFSFMMGATLKDKNRADDTVGILAKMKGAFTPSPPKPNVYMAQAEFYFDCNSTWDTSICNGNDYAAYSPKWRVRLRRLRTPVAGAELGGAAVELLATGASAITAPTVAVPNVDDAVQRMTAAASAQVGTALADQMKSFFSLPIKANIGVNVPSLGINVNLDLSNTASVGNLPMPTFSH